MCLNNFVQDCSNVNSRHNQPLGLFYHDSLYHQTMHQTPCFLSSLEPLPPCLSSALGFSFQVFLVAPDSSTCLRTVSGLSSVGSRKSLNFSSKHERSSETFKIFQAILPLFQGIMLYFLSVL